MSHAGDDVSDMPVTPLLDDATIDALIRGDDVHPRHRDLATFATMVRAAGERPPPAPSAALAAVLAGDTGLRAAGDRPERDRPEGDRPEGDRPALTRRTGTLAKAAGLGVAVKLMLGASAAAAGVLGAGAAGVLPDAADDRVRHALETVTPLDFPEADEGESDDGPAGDPSPGPDARDAGDGPGTTDGGLDSGWPGQGADGPTAADQSDRGVAQNAPAGSPPDDGSLPDQAEERRPEVTPPSTIPAGPSGAGNGGQAPTTLPDESADDEDVPADQRADTDAPVP